MSPVISAGLGSISAFPHFAPPAVFPSASVDEKPSALRVGAFAQKPQVRRGEQPRGGPDDAGQDRFEFAGGVGKVPPKDALSAREPNARERTGKKSVQLREAFRDGCVPARERREDSMERPAQSEGVFECPAGNVFFLSIGREARLLSPLDEILGETEPLFGRTARAPTDRVVEVETGFASNPFETRGFHHFMDYNL